MIGYIWFTCYDDMTMEDILVVVGKMKKTLDWLLYNLDTTNAPAIGQLLLI